MSAGAPTTSGREIAAAALAQERIKYGPWLGSIRSMPPDRVPREYMAGTNATNFLFMPRYGYWRRRGGQTEKFDTFGAEAGLLPAKWSSKARWMEEYIDDTMTDHVPTVATLLTRETVSTGLDDGRFSTLWFRDQVANANYTWGSEFASDTYPEPGTKQTYRVIPLWYDSGDGGITRGVSEFLRRFFFGGSRRFLTVAGWNYLPSVLGTPSRNRRSIESVSIPAGDLQASSDITTFGTEWGTNGAATQWEAVQTADDDTTFAHRHGDVGTYNFVMGLNGAASTDINDWTVTYRARREGNLPSGATYAFGLSRSDNQIRFSADISAADLTTSWVNYTTTITFGSTASGPGANSITLNAVVPIFFDGYIEITYLKISQAGAGTSENQSVIRTIPSGPLPPTHAGLLVKGNAVAGSSGVTEITPDADISDGAWLGNDAGTSLFSYIDETDAQANAGTADADWIVDAGAPGTACVIRLDNPGFNPTSSTHTVLISIRASGNQVFTSPELTVRLLQDPSGAATVRATASFTAAQLTSGGATAARWLSYSMTAAEIDATTDWADIGLSFTAGGTAGVRVHYAHLYVTAVGEALVGGWRGKDRFMYSIAYRFKDDSVWMPCTPRFPNTILTNGFNLFTVDEDNTETAFDKVSWTHLPVPPFDVKELLLMRTTKIDSTADDNLQIDPKDLRLVAVVKAGTTSYDDYAAEDDALGLDAEQLVIRYDHSMPPRCRYIAGGDMRVAHSYGGTNPCAIEIAAVGAAADYDRNLADSNASVYAADGMYFRVVIDSAGAGSLELKRANDTTVVYLFATYTTIQDLVDKINTTTSASGAGQWRAQLCPDVDQAANCLTSLTPHSRALTNCVTTSSDATITRAAGSLSKIAVGTRVSGTGIPNDTYVTTITDDATLELSANATASGTVTLTFYVALGDTPDTGLGREGWQRCIANSLPGFIFFNKTYLDLDTFDKSATWMTIATPGSMKSAPNSFSYKIANRFTPPLSAGIAMGIAAVDQGFAVFYANKRGVIENRRDTGSGVDEDYRLQIRNESSGCCAWNTVVAGNRFAIALAPEGLIACDLDGERLISEAIWQHGASDGSSQARGDFSYEIPLSVAATAADNDTAYASARIIRSAIYLNFRASGSHPNRQVVLDFSSGSDVSGLPALFRRPGDPWGWSVPMVRSFTVMCEGRRSDGSHLYGWNEANGGSTGDGRIDEFETGDTDNGTAIAASVEVPWLRVGSNQLSAQEITLEHKSPAASTGALVFHRSLSDDQYSMTPSTGSTEYVRDVKMLPLAARSPTSACFIGYSQATGSARELRSIELRLKSLPSYK